MNLEKNKNKYSQEEIDNHLLMHLFKEDMFICEQEYKDNYLENYNGERNINTVKDYISLSFNTLKEIKVLIYSNLNPKYSNVYDIKDKQLIIDITIKSIQKYRKLKTKIDDEIRKVQKTDSKFEKSFNLSKTTNRGKQRILKDREFLNKYYGDYYKKHLTPLAEMIEELLDRFILKQQESEISGVYNVKTDFESWEVIAVRDLLFKKLLFIILDGNEGNGLRTISSNKITDELEAYSSHLSGNTSKADIKTDVIKAFTLLEIFTEKKTFKVDKEKLRNKNTPPKSYYFEIVEIADKEWRMNAKTKIDSIKDIVGRLTRVNKNKISEKEKNAVLEIFNYSCLV